MTSTTELTEEMKADIINTVNNWEVRDDSDIRTYKTSVPYGDTWVTASEEYDDDEYYEAQKKELIKFIETDGANEYLKTIEAKFCEIAGNNFENEKEAENWLNDINTVVINFIERI